jgi:hypothetical protein
MSVFFAAARSTATSPVARVLTRCPVPLAANDMVVADARDQDVLHAALRHFGTHGLGAAHAAFSEAARARQIGDHSAGDRWSAICRMLDKRLDAALATQYSADQP